MASRVNGLRRAGVTHDKYPEYLALLASLIRRGGRTRAFVESFTALRIVAGRNPYQEDKEKLNEAMLARAEQLRETMMRAGLQEALEIAAAANAVDVAMLDYSFEGKLHEALGERPVYAYTSRERVEKLLAEASTIALILDNAGEAVIDLLLAERLQNEGYRVTIYARTSAYETDVTEQEARTLAERLGIDARIRGSGTGYPPHHPSSETRREIEQHDLVLAKGIANLETSLEAPLQTNTLALLRAKCRPLARLFSTRIGAPVVTEPNNIPLRLRS